jgi:hypothetical protein
MVHYGPGVQQAHDSLGQCFLFFSLRKTGMRKNTRTYYFLKKYKDVLETGILGAG